MADDDKPLIDMEAIAAEAIQTEDIIVPDPDRKSARAKVKEAAESVSKASKAAPPYKAGMFVKPLTQFYVLGGAAILPFDQKCGNVLIQSAEQCAQSLDTLAKTNPRIRKALATLIETGAWGAVLTAHAPIIIAVATHHVPLVQGVMAKVATAGIPTTEEPY